MFYLCEFMDTNGKIWIIMITVYIYIVYYLIIKGLQYKLFFDTLGFNVMQLIGH